MQNKPIEKAEAEEDISDIWDLDTFDDDPWYEDEWFIIGCSLGVGGLALIVMIGICCCCCRRYKRRLRPSSYYHSTNVTNFGPGATNTYKSAADSFTYVDESCICREVEIN